MEEKTFKVPKYVLENIENTLSIAYMNRSTTVETCFDRAVKCCLSCVRKILNNVELTGKERLEKVYQ